MAKRAPGRQGTTTGRVTPKGTAAKGTAAKGNPPRDKVPASSSRYTPPIPREEKVSPRWVPALMFFFLLGGAVMILLNYLSLLPGAPDNRYLLGGLGFITAGFVTATRYH